MQRRSLTNQSNQLARPTLRPNNSTWRHSPANRRKHTDLTLIRIDIGNIQEAHDARVTDFGESGDHVLATSVTEWFFCRRRKYIEDQKFCQALSYHR